MLPPASCAHPATQALPQRCAPDPRTPAERRYPAGHDPQSTRKTAQPCSGGRLPMELAGYAYSTRRQVTKATRSGAHLPSGRPPLGKADFALSTRPQSRPEGGASCKPPVSTAGRRPGRGCAPVADLHIDRLRCSEQFLDDNPLGPRDVDRRPFAHLPRRPLVRPPVWRPCYYFLLLSLLFVISVFVCVLFFVCFLLCAFPMFLVLLLMHAHVPRWPLVRPPLWRPVYYCWLLSLLVRCS